MAKYLDIPQGATIKSKTCFRENEDGQPIIQTDMAEVMNLSENPGTHGLALGRAIRGSLRLVSLGEGRYGIRARPFQHDSEAAIRQTQENIASTTHGQCYRTARQTKLVFTFPHNISFQELADHLDDEVYELRTFFYKESEAGIARAGISAGSQSKTGYMSKANVELSNGGGKKAPARVLPRGAGKPSPQTKSLKQTLEKEAPC